MRLDEIPLPRGPKAWEAAGLLADGVTVHVTSRRAGQTVQQDAATGP